MLIIGKIYEIEKSSPDRDIYTVVLEKTRKGKKIYIPVTFWGNLAKDVTNNVSNDIFLENFSLTPDPIDKKRPMLKIGMRIDVQVYLYGKPTIASGKRFWNSYIIAESWRPYVSGSKRYREIVNKETGETIKRKAEIPREYDQV